MQWLLRGQLESLTTFKLFDLNPALDQWFFTFINHRTSFFSNIDLKPPRLQKSISLSRWL